MSKYIRERIRSDAVGTIASAANQSFVQHKGMRGRFRELLVNNLLQPWLPPYVACGTGMIVDANDNIRKSTQEDIILFDRSIVPSALISQEYQEGVFPTNGVLMRIEVKSKLNRIGLKKALLAASEVHHVTVQATERNWPGITSALFAFDSDLIDDPTNPHKELQRMIDLSYELELVRRVNSGASPFPIQCLCVAGKGAWGNVKFPSIREDMIWVEADFKKKGDEIIFFVGVISNTCFNAHLERIGLNPEKSMSSGIGRFVLADNPFHEIEVSPNKGIKADRR